MSDGQVIAIVLIGAYAVVVTAIGAVALYRRWKQKMGATMMKNNVSAQVNIDILATDQFDVNGFFFDHATGAIKPIHGGSAKSMQEAWQKAVEVASGLVIAIGRMEDEQNRPKFRVVK